MTTKMIQFELPWPPSVNHYWGRHGNRYFIKPQGKQFIQDVQNIVLISPKCPQIYDSRLSMSILASPPDKRVRDIDNLPKAILDAFKKAGVYKDDHQIKRLYIEMLDPQKPGTLKVQITKYEAMAQSQG